MASDLQARNRTHLLCPFCKNTHSSLPTHLVRTCMKRSPKEDVARVVEGAKKEAHELLRVGRVWNYKDIKYILDSPDPLGRMIKELQDRGNAVHQTPTEKPAPASAPSPPAPSPPAPSPPAPVETASETDSSESSGDLYQCPDTVTHMASLREKMKSKGLYNKHSLDHPLLSGFRNWLKEDLSISNHKQEVENVARFMYFMDDKRPTLHFVRDRERSCEYFTKLSEVGLTKQTVSNYIKSLKRFMRYVTGSTNLIFQDRDLHMDCKEYIPFLNNVQTGVSKQVAKEVLRKNYDTLREGTLPIPEVVAVLTKAKRDFLAIMGKVLPSTVPPLLTQAELLLCLNYLEAVVMLKHAQLPSVVENMTATEWTQRTKVDGHAVVGVKEHKTSSTQVATFALDEEEESWFQEYFIKVRPQLLKGRGGRKRKHSEDEGDSPGRYFFISSTGNPIYNACNDLKQLHNKYGLPNVTTQMARRAYKTAAHKNMTDCDKTMVADYLAHSSATAEKHYCIKESSSVVKVSLLLQKLHSDEEHTKGEAASSSRHYMDGQVAFDLLVKAHPVTLEGVPPKKSERASLTGAHERYCYDRWRAHQLELRVQHVVEHFGRRLPSESRVRRWIEKQGWTANLPDAELVVSQWQPPGSIDTALDSRAVQKMHRTQKWKGLAVVDTEGKGRGVLTTRPFAKGEVVCDYHGRVVTRQEGLKIHQATVGTETSYMFFYNSGQSTMCIDAHEEECLCHPGMRTYGRLINHSSKRDNLRPRLFTLDGTDVIVFIASRDICVNEELLFNYGVSKKSFAGEGLDLEWL